MNEIQEKLLVNHPIWKYGSMGTWDRLFRLKGYRINSLYVTDARKLKKDILREYILALQDRLPTIKLISQPDFDRVDGAKIFQTFSNQQNVGMEIRDLTYLDDTTKISRKYYSFGNSFNDGLMIFIYDKIEEVKYLFAALLDKSRKSLNAKTIFRDSAKFVIANSSNLFSLYEITRQQAQRACDRALLTSSKLYEFLTHYENDTKEDSTIPKSAIFFYFCKRSGLPPGWVVRMFEDGERTELTYKGLIKTPNAYVNDKVTPLKLPMWIEEFKLIYAGDGLYEMKAKGFHNDLDCKGRLRGGFMPICTGDLPVNKLWELVMSKRVEEFKDALNRITRGLSVTNLEHPHWSFGGKVWATMQVIGEEKKDGD